MRTAVFLVKNGIGFGHIRRALLVAEAVQRAGRLRPIVISQASSLALYRDTPVRVVNLPLLHRVPSAVIEDSYTDLLDRILDQLEPAVVVEDTYPDARYQRLPALADRPRLLVMRRLDGLSFDQLRLRGGFAHYDRILIAQDEAAFRREDHSGDTLAAVIHGDRCSFVGNIAYAPTLDEALAVRRAYVPDTAPLVVVNGGAGGDQMPDGYGDRLFSACWDVAETLGSEGHPARFVFVTGPYYAGRPLRPTDNVVVRRFEPRLAPLLAAADVAVIKPGNNALSEALAGHGQLVLVPDVSFMEGLDEHAARTVARYGGVVSTPDRDNLEPLIRAALRQPPRQERLVTAAAATDAVVEEIHAHADTGSAWAKADCISAKALLLMLAPPAYLTAAALSAQLPDSLGKAIVLDDAQCDGAVVTIRRLADHTPGTVDAVVADRDPGALTPQALADHGVRMLLQPQPTPAMERWIGLERPRPSLLVVPTEVLVARPDAPEAIHRRVARLLHAHASAVLLLDLGAVPPEHLTGYLRSVERWAVLQRLQLVGIRDVAAERANLLLEGSAR